MKIKTGVVVFIIVAVFSILSFRSLRVDSRSQQEQLAELENAPDKGSIAWHARVAQVKGQRKVVIPGPINDYATGISGLDEALSHYGAVVAQLISRKSYIASTNELYRNNEIRTWYKFRILESLSRKPLPKCSTCGVDRETEKRIPPEMSSLNPDEILIEAVGGTVEVEGVKVTMLNRQIPDFSESRHYLLFLSTDPSGKVGLLNLGPVGIYAISSSDQIEPVGQHDHPLARDIRNLHSNSLESLKGYIQGRSPVQ